MTAVIVVLVVLVVLLPSSTPARRRHRRRRRTTSAVIILIVPVLRLLVIAPACCPVVVLVASLTVLVVVVVLARAVAVASVTGERRVRRLAVQSLPGTHQVLGRLDGHRVDGHLRVVGKQHYRTVNNETLKDLPSVMQSLPNLTNSKVYKETS